MIRNVVVGTVKPGVAREDIEKALQTVRELRIEGVELRVAAGVDLGLREGNASYALTVDLADEQAYRIYDLDPEHNRIRNEVFAPITERVDRIQIRL